MIQWAPMAVGELTPPPQDDPLVGKVICERYRVIKKLGEGGMGAVYLAEHVFIEKKVALKVLAPELARKAELTARFLQEAKSASRIGHENVIDISDFGQSPEGFVFFAMEFLQGQDLGQVVRAEGAMTWRRARPIIVQICKALGAAHAKGIIHRDMKPENVFIIDRGGRADFVKLLDFGIAKVQTEAGDDGPKLTRTGMIFGTPEYMAPEQAEGKVCDQRADVYAVGCMIHHLIAGEAPFQAENFVAMLTKHLLETPKPPSLKRPELGIPPELDALVLKALAKQPAERFQSMADVLAAVESISETAGGRGRSPSTQPAARGNLTRPLGGSDGMPLIASSGRVSNTEMMVSGGPAFADAPEAVEDDERAPNPRSGKGLLVIGGIALGAVVALAWLLLGHSAPPPVAGPAPLPTAGQVPVSPVTVPAPVPEPAALIKAQEAAEPVPPPHPKLDRPTRREDPPQQAMRPAAPKGPEPPRPGKAPQPETPAELKGFPGE